jgi:hypothetical protein
VSQRIYGASDDLIELEGDIRDEIGCYGIDDDKDVKWYLALSDGTLLSVNYDGRWRFAVVTVGGAQLSKIEATEDEGSRADGTPAYSDVVTLDGPKILWAALSKEVVR